jgi:hypothetical protein
MEDIVSYETLAHNHKTTSYSINLPIVVCKAVSRQRLSSKLVPASTDTHATVEVLGPCKGTIEGSLLQLEGSRRSERNSHLLEAVTGQLLVRTLRAGSRSVRSSK